MTAHNSTPHVCPWWVGYLLVSPLRRFFQDPGEVLGPHVREGMTVLEIGPGMGYFSLPLARLVGKEGRVLCVDVQEKMLQGLKRRAEKAKLLERIVIVRASDDSLHLEGYRSAVDFTLAFAVVHEVRDQAWLLEQINQAMKPGSLLLISEPRGHVNDQEFERTVAVARAKGYDLVERLRIRRSNSVVMKKSNVPHSASGPQSM